MHRRHEAQELREALRGEGEIIVSDSTEAQRDMLEHLKWLAERHRVVMAAVWAGASLSAEPVAPTRISWEYPDDPIYRTAQSNGRTSVLSREELFAYADIAADVQWGLGYEQALEAAADKRLSFERGLPPALTKDKDGKQEIDFSHQSREDLRKYLELLSGEYNAAVRFRGNCLLTRGLAEAVLRGVRAPEALGAAEAQGARSEAPSPE